MYQEKKTKLESLIIEFKCNKPENVYEKIKLNKEIIKNKNEVINHLSTISDKLSFIKMDESIDEDDLKFSIENLLRQYENLKSYISSEPVDNIEDNIEKLSKLKRLKNAIALKIKEKKNNLQIKV